MSTPEPRYNPDNDDTTDTSGVQCRGCDHFILDASDEEAWSVGGWWWCSDCYDALPEVNEGRMDELTADERRGK